MFKTESEVCQMVAHDRDFAESQASENIKTATKSCGRATPDRARYPWDDPIGL